MSCLGHEGKHAASKNGHGNGSGDNTGESAGETEDRISTAAIPTARFAPNVSGSVNPPAAPAKNIKAGIDRLIDRGNRVANATIRENIPVVIQVIKNQLLASIPVNPS